MTWDEFVREVLPSGEIKRVMVNSLQPQKAIVTLHRGATFQNREVGECRKLFRV